MYVRTYMHPQVHVHEDHRTPVCAKLGSCKFKEALDKLHENYVLIPADKACNHVIVVCKHYYKQEQTVIVVCKHNIIITSKF